MRTFKIERCPAYGTAFTLFFGPQARAELLRQLKERISAWYELTSCAPIRDLDLEAGLPSQAADLARDLRLEVVPPTDKQFIHRVLNHVVLTGLSNIDTIRYHQELLQECSAHPEVMRGFATYC